MSESAALPRRGSVRSRISRTLYNARDFVSRQSLAASCGISMPTLYQNLNELMEDGLVCYSGQERSTGGRRAQGLDVVPDAHRPGRGQARHRRGALRFRQSSPCRE